jgi:uncharacterized RmlC-like cupin family protein
MLLRAVMIVKPKSSSTVRHHGEQGTSPVLAARLLSHPEGLGTAGHTYHPWPEVTVEDAIIYVASGKGVLLSSPNDEDEDEKPERYDLEQGDFACVPAWTEHQALNESEEDLLWVIIRSGSQPVEVNLTDWGGPEATDLPRQ